MDTINSKLIDANRARDILRNTHDRLSKLGKKTNEDYVRILIEEVNKYFVSMDSSSIDSRNLPNKKKGPLSEEHNLLLSSILNDIDLINTKQELAEKMITKAVNYMSSERDGIIRSISNLQSRILNFKMRSSFNDKGLLTFTESFNDDKLVDSKLSTNTTVNEKLGALSLAPQSLNNDNSNLIDASSIEIVPVIDEKPSNVYPISNNSGKMGYGVSLSSKSLSSEEAFDSNIMRASYDDPERCIDIQNQCLKSNNEFKENRCEFEIVISNMDDALKNIISDLTDSGVNPEKLLIDSADRENHINSLSGTNDSEPLKNYIKEFDLKFKMKKGATLAGNLNRITIKFDTPDVDKGGFQPTIDSLHSTINNQQVFKASRTNTNNITEMISIPVSKVIKNPENFIIRFRIEEMYIFLKELPNYWGCYWRIHKPGITKTGNTSTGDILVNTSSSFYIYHDLIRDKENKKSTNLKIAKTILNNLRKESDI